MLLDARRPAQFALFHSHPEETDRVVRRNLDRDVGADVGTGDPSMACSGRATTPWVAEPLGDRFRLDFPGTIGSNGVLFRKLWGGIGVGRRSNGENPDGNR